MYNVCECVVILRSHDPLLLLIETISSSDLLKPTLHGLVYNNRSLINYLKLVPGQLLK